MKKKICLIIIAIALISQGKTFGSFTDFYSDAEIKSGDVYDEVHIHQNAHVIMSGGYANAVETYNSSMFDMKGGNIFTLEADYQGTINMWAGEVAVVGATGNGIVNIYGGQITGSDDPFWPMWLMGWDNSQINIYGGSIPQVELYGPCTLTIYGTGLQYNNQGLYTGTLASGESLHMYGPGYNVKLVEIPEPASMFILGLGSLFLRKKVS